MPVYEYQCPACGARSSRFFRSASTAAAPIACDGCNAPDVSRIVSAFAVHQSLATQIDNIDPQFERQIDAAMRPHLASDPLNRINLRGFEE